MSATSKLNHYYLVSGEVSFTRKDSEVVERISLNTTIANDLERVTAKDIGRAQQALQMLLFKRGDVTLTVTDVFIVAISYLGRMNQETFLANVEELQNG